MAKSKQDPQIEWGFHAVVPRIVRTGYEKLSPVQKWLYVCLKDLCGEHGTCYRALRVLAGETGISTGMLSESIRALHDAGLIHAEKKRRSNNPTAKEVWHITIVDIWQANAKEHPTKRSQNEHSNEDNVHTVNNNVQQVNNIGSERSQNEPKRSHSETEEVSLSSINIEAVSLEEGIATSAEDRNAPANIIPQNRLQERITDKHKAINLKGQAAHGNSSNDLPRSGNDSNGDNVQPGTSGETGGQVGRGNVQHDSGRQAEAESQLEQTISTKVIGQTPVQRSGVSPSTGTLARPDAAQGNMAMTTRQIRAQNEKREKELWVIIEQELGTKYTVRQKAMHLEGITSLIADDISDEAIRAGLQALDAFQRKSFTVYKFYGWLPNLSAKAPTPITKGKTPESNGVDHERNKRRLEELSRRFDEEGPKLKGLELRRHA